MHGNRSRSYPEEAVRDIQQIGAYRQNMKIYKEKSLSLLDDCVREDYIRRRELRHRCWRIQRNFPVLGLATGILFLA